MDVSSLPLFKAIPEEHLEWALSHFRAAEVDYGMRLMEEGEVDATLLCVLSGELEIRTGDTLLGRARAGDVVGEIAMFGYGMRMASVETVTNAEVLLLDRAGYEALRAAGSPVAQAIEEFALATLMDRLTTTSDRISQLAQGTPAATMTPNKGFFRRVAEMFGAGGRRPAVNLDVGGVLANAPFFQGAAPEGLAELAGTMQGLEFSPGSFVCTEGELGDEMFIVAEGVVDVVISTGDDRVEPLAALEPGDAFGMVALLDDRPRMASCIARSQVAALSLPKKRWGELIRANSPGGSALRGALIRCLADQLSFANAQLAQLDLTQKRRAEGGQLQPLLMASAGMEAYGRHTRGDE
jgi:CRP-like cAMP-binding protein